MAEKQIFERKYDVSRVDRIEECNRQFNVLRDRIEKLKSELPWKLSNSTERKLQLDSNDALFLLANCQNNKYAIVGTESIGNIYDKYKDEDGFLYIIYSNEKVWG